MLAQAPDTVIKVHEMAFNYNDAIPSAYNTLTPQERIMVYYLYRASAACTGVVVDQFHRHGLKLISLFSKLRAQAEKIEHSQLSFDRKNFNSDVEAYLLYLLANHGQYFQREHGEEKRTPARIGLTTLTTDTLAAALTHLGKSTDVAWVKNNESIIFDAKTEGSATVHDNIPASAVNFYAREFTEEDYLSIPAEKRTHLNTYFDVTLDGNKRTPVVIPYAVSGRYSKELAQANAWLAQAHALALQYPQTFDHHFAKSLQLMIDFLQTGDEELFKQHSIEWLKTSSRLDYNFGFIECYDDPKAVRSTFQAEVTVKTVDISALNKILPKIEAELPFSDAFKRDGVKEGTASIPNASINVQLFATGGLGPMSVTAAYCLPNYEEIRSEHGSKQIIYPSRKSTEFKLNPDKCRRLFNSTKNRMFLEKYDSEGNLGRALWDTQCILHETIGHASGKLATHTFVTGDKLSIGDKTYTVGDTIPVTNKNISEFLSGYESTLEELRAEIIALYVSVEHLDTLLEAGFLKQWANLFGKETLIDRLILNMAGTGINRLFQLSDTATEITGDHARANCTIMNFLIENGGLDFVEEKVTVDDKEFTVLDLHVKDQAKSRTLIKELMLEVQRIKSTGDGQAVARLITTYGSKPRSPEHPRLLRAAREHIMGKIRATVSIFPVFKPIQDAAGKVIDSTAVWPSSFLEGYYQSHPEIVDQA